MKLDEISWELRPNEIIFFVLPILFAVARNARVETNVYSLCEHVYMMRSHCVLSLPGVSLLPVILILFIILENSYISYSATYQGYFMMCSLHQGYFMMCSLHRFAIRISYEDFLSLEKCCSVKSGKRIKWTWQKCEENMNGPQVHGFQTTSVN
jgi:hypothetical protein